MVASVVLATLTRLGRVSHVVGHARLSPCRLGRKLSNAVGVRVFHLDIAEVDWFEGIEPDELAG
jgi:hypothetical protein